MRRKSAQLRAVKTIRAFNRLSLGAFALVLGVGTMLVLAAGRIAAERARADLSAEAAQSANLLGALLASEIEHYRALPLVLASDAQVASALTSSDQPARQQMNERLAGLSSEIGAAAIYLIGADGITIAASNAGQRRSFIGDNYRFRQYFQSAMRDGRGTQFALGSTTQRPGLYLAERVTAGGRAVGVAVVKVEFNLLEENWRRSGSIALVTDDRGEVLVTTQPSWRFARIDNLLPGADSGARLHELSSAPQGGLIGPGTYHRATASAIIPGWTVHTLLRGDTRVYNAVAAASALTALAIALLGSVLLWVLLRQRRAAVRAREAEQARQELEQRVEERTAELSSANQRLVAEITERQRAEEAARLLNEELGQANRLAILGQIAAGVTHEINQPVAAIRATADNAATMLDQGQGNAARSAIGRIARLTERIGAITGELRAFSAKRPGGARLIAVDTALDGALQLVGPSLKQTGIALNRPPRAPDLKIWAERIRAEQILVNLLRNAIEALDGVSDPAITITTRADASFVEILIADNGPGIDPEIAEVLFTPFRTTKDGGLGLGLVISRDIATSLGGELTLAKPRDGESGVTFVLRLRRTAGAA